MTTLEDLLDGPAASSPGTATRRREIVSNRTESRTTPTARSRSVVPAWLPDLVIVIGLTVVVAAVHAHAGNGGPAPGDDEGTYVAQAYAINHFGSLAPYTYWYDHPPLGWILIALWNATFGHLSGSLDAIAAGRQFLVVVAAISGALIYLLGRRLGLRRLAATAAVLAWTFSPLALSYSRMVYLDNIAMPFVLGALLLALSPRRHLAAYAGSGLLLAMAVLTKETMLLAAPAIGYAVWRSSAGRTRAFCVAAFSATAVLVLALYPLLAVLRGELLPGPDHVSLYDALRFQLLTRPSSGSPLAAGTQAHALVAQWLRLDPWLLAGGVLLTPFALAVRRLRAAGLAVAVPVILSLRPGYLPDPFVIALLPLCALVVAGVADTGIGYLALRLTGRRPRVRDAVAGNRVQPLMDPQLVRDGGGHWRAAPTLRRLRPAVTALGIAVGLTALLAATAGPSWASSDHAMYADTSQQTTVAAEDWIAAHVSHRARIVVDDTLWVDLVDRGFNPHLGVIWFYKTDFTNNLDPSVARQLPQGYRDLQYVVSTPVIRSALAQLPTGLAEVRAALKYSVPIATFGTGTQQIVVRRLDVPANAPQLPSPVKP